MCGIYGLIARASATHDATISSNLQRCLRNRGPDHLGQITARQGDLGLTFASTVLSLRGDHVTEQPFRDASSGSILCWNGEAWKIGGCGIDGNDGADVFRRLGAASGSACGTDGAAEEAVLEVLRSIEGPFAFIYFDDTAGRVYFGRDRLGRRSLLIRWDEDAGRIALSSIAESADSGWQEVAADGIYTLNLDHMWSGTDAAELRSSAIRHEWMTANSDDFVSSIGLFNMDVTSTPSALSPRSPSVQQLHQRLTESLELRILSIPNPPTPAPNTDTRVAVLFSGGLDCTVLARMCHDILPKDQGVDLINVAFENPRVAAQLSKQADGVATNVYEACPDRITGRKSFSELLSVCLGRAWRFIAVNVPYTETVSHRPEVISLMYPHNTEMDLSIAYALYFSARGIGVGYTADNPIGTPYSTPARVLLSGLGADELFGGYTRHGVAFSRGGYRSLAEELKLDVGRLGQRNLGRDDRVMAHWGREVRFPYLDEAFVKWAIECSVWQKCDFANPAKGESSVEPEKRVLRLLAAELGMHGAAREKKRAIQFGSRTAKMESGKAKGTSLIS